MYINEKMRQTKLKEFMISKPVLQKIKPYTQKRKINTTRKIQKRINFIR
jgi:hypothetical protein